MSPQPLRGLLSDALNTKLGISCRTDQEGMNKETWSSPLDHDGEFQNELPLSPSSMTHSPALDFGWPNENSSFDNTALDILDYNAISDCAEENVTSDVDISPIDFSPITPQASGPFEKPASPKQSYETSRMLPQPSQSPRDSGLDLNFPDWNRNTFWKTVFSNSTAWNTVNATHAALLGESVHRSHMDLPNDVKNTSKEEMEGVTHRMEHQILQTAQNMSPMLVHRSEGKQLDESHPGDESANINFQAPLAGACLEKSDEFDSPKLSRLGEDRARPWACELCASRFSIKGHLSQHNRYVHEKYRPHTCPSCSASFGTRFARSQHIWTVHERKKPFVCEVMGCKASFGQRSHLNRHAKRHRSDNGKKE
jgi:rubrerythrin